MRIHHIVEGECLHEGVNVTSGIHYDYVIFFRSTDAAIYKSEAVIPKANPSQYNFYEWVFTRALVP